MKSIGMPTLNQLRSSAQFPPTMLTTSRRYCNNKVVHASAKRSV